MKSVRLQPLNTTIHLQTGAALLDGLLAKALKVQTACGGRGLCATCHVHVRHGRDKLSPMQPREKRTLGFIAATDADSRLACQCLITADGIVVEVPAGMYVLDAAALAERVGDVADKDYLHPVTAAVLIPAGKVITRTMLKLCYTAAADLQTVRESI